MKKVDIREQLNRKVDYMKKISPLFRMIILVLVLSLGLTMSVSAVTASNVVNGIIPLENLLEEAEDFDSLPPEFLRDISQYDALSVDSLTRFAEEHEVTAGYLQRFVDDYFVFKQGDTYQHIPVNQNLAKNDYDFNNLVSYGDVKDYVVDGQSMTIKGIDVSQFQGIIDWNRVANDGVEFAFIRLGYRGYQSGKLNMDKYFYRNLEGAKAAGIDVGVYFYSQAKNYSEGIAEAQYVLRALEGYELDYPVAFDIEGPPASSARTYYTSNQQFTDAAIGFCDTIAAGGYDPMVYSYAKFIAENLYLDQLTAYPMWMAMYYNEPFYPYEMDIWQYSCTGRVDGISGDVDLNMQFVLPEPTEQTAEQQAAQ